VESGHLINKVLTKFSGLLMVTIVNSIHARSLKEADMCVILEHSRIPWRRHHKSDGPMGLIP
jgi:hypothetical protein